jgi:hypothetical protein
MDCVTDTTHVDQKRLKVSPFETPSLPLQGTLYLLSEPLVANCPILTQFGMV